MKITRSLSLALCAALLPGLVGAADPSFPVNGKERYPGAGPRKVRIGTYSSRAVALAYLRSERFEARLEAWRRGIEDAKRKDDAAAVASIEKKMRGQQRRAHLQGFGDAPIPDIIADLGEAVAETARKEGLAAVVRSADIAFRDPSVEVVDITVALVDACKPTETTRKMASEIDRHPPVPLEDFPIDCDGEGHGTGTDVKLPPPERSGELAADAWLRLVDEEYYMEARDKASARFRGASDRKKWLDDLGSRKAALGKVLSRKLRSKKHAPAAPGTPGGGHVLVVFESVFEKKPAAVEEIRCTLDEEGRWRVDEYSVR
jgi:hypothetical protein